jgi:D-alanine-D-alanine ligase
MSEARVAVVSGGPSAEAEVSRSGAAAVASALESAGFSVLCLELDARLPATLSASAVDTVFPVTHGAVGEDGCLQGLLEVLDLPYVGSGVLASALAMNKPQAKLVFRAAGLPLARDRTLSRGADVAGCAAELWSELGPALVVKPASGGSAIGVRPIAIGDGDAALLDAVQRVWSEDPVALVETAVKGSDLTCSVLEEASGPRALPITLIRPKAAGFYDFTSKYRPGASEHLVPAPLPPELTREIGLVAVRAHSLLGCRDLSRVDFLWNESDGSFVLLEVNTLPGMTATSLFPEAAQAVGIDFQTLCVTLVRRALARPRAEKPRALALP